MAEIAITDESRAGNTDITVWGPLTSANLTGAPKQLFGSADRSVQISGTFNGATVAIHGSNDGVNYVALRDNYGDAIAVTSAGIISVGDLSLYVKPVISGAGGSTSLTITLLTRGPF